jgi:hypothetical protein
MSALTQVTMEPTVRHAHPPGFKWLETAIKARPSDGKQVWQTSRFS